MKAKYNVCKTEIILTFFSNFYYLFIISKNIFGTKVKSIFSFCILFDQIIRHKHIYAKDSGHLQVLSPLCFGEILSSIFVQNIFFKKVPK